jgi:hypothetical protein
MMVEHIEPDETAALLPSLLQTRADAVESSLPSRLFNRSWSWKYTVAMCIMLAIISDVGECLYVAPRVRLFESVVCSEYYSQEDPSLVSRDGSVPEHLCKIDPVQDVLTSILGWQLFFDSIPAILLPIPYGYLADRFGRKWILFFALAGYTLSWALSLFFVYLKPTILH